MPDLCSRLDAFLAALPVADIAADVAAAGGISQSEVVAGSGLKSAGIAGMLQNYVNETRAGFELVREHLDPERRMLEVGAGLCLLSLFLRREGFDVVALEPALAGHELFDLARRSILARFSDVDLTVLDCTAQELRVSEHGSFDLVFSNNVIEHIPDWQQAMQAMRGVLTGQGYMLHGCPNYTVPYEPHYGVPVFRRLPGLSRRLFLPKAADAGIWDSLNFITCAQIRRYCARNGLPCSFRKGLLYQAIRRVDEDALFRQRHQGVVAGLAGLLLRLGLGRMLKALPPGMATPMIVRIGTAGAA